MKKNIENLVKILILVLVVVVFIFIYKNFYKTELIPERIEVTLDKCIDGDTVWLKSDGIRKKYRLLGIDTPEVDESYGSDSTVYTCSLLMSAEKIEIEYDNLSDKKDKYGRELVWIFVDDELLQNKILLSGYGEVKYIYNDYIYLDELYKSEKSAKDNNLGIWKN